MATSCSLLIPHSQVAVLNLPKEPLNPLTLPGTIPPHPTALLQPFMYNSHGSTFLEVTGVSRPYSQWTSLCLTPSSSLYLTTPLYYKFV